jgi:hypothetical protein
MLTDYHSKYFAWEVKEVEVESEPEEDPVVVRESQACHHSRLSRQGPAEMPGAG